MANTRSDAQRTLKDMKQGVEDKNPDEVKDAARLDMDQTGEDIKDKLDREDRE